jgi:hypothetical protein
LALDVVDPSDTAPAMLATDTPANDSIVRDSTKAAKIEPSE